MNMNTVKHMIVCAGERPGLLPGLGPPGMLELRGHARLHGRRCHLSLRFLGASDVLVCARRVEVRQRPQGGDGKATDSSAVPGSPTYRSLAQASDMTISCYRSTHGRNSLRSARPACRRCQARGLALSHATWSRVDAACLEIEGQARPGPPAILTPGYL